jgi:hypothetical protein
LNPAIYIPGSTLSTDARRPFQPYTSIVQGTGTGSAWYNSMQWSLEKRFSQGFTILANYTWSKSQDNLPAGADVTSPMLNAALGVSPYVPDFKALDRGPSDFDYNHVFVVSYVWEVSALANANRWLRAVAGGWQLSGIFSGQSGGPITITAGQDRSQTGGSDKGVWLGQPARGSGACGNTAPCVDFLAPTAFALPALGSYGSIAKGTFRGPGAFNSDIGLSKRFPIREHLNLQFRAEAFNAFNQVNLSNPTSSISGAGFGSIRGSRDPRIGQLALKLTF